MKIFYVAVLSLTTLSIELNANIVSNSITVLSIIFGFSMAYLGSVYANDGFNKILKRNKVLSDFLEQNKRYLMNFLIYLIIVFLIGSFDNYKYVFKFSWIMIDIYLQTYAVISFLTIYTLFKTIDIVKDFFMV